VASRALADRNLEAVPTSESADKSNGADHAYFARVSVFKQHLSALPTATRQSGTDAHAALQFWHDRTRAHLGSSQWFFFCAGRGRLQPSRRYARRAASVAARVYRLVRLIATPARKERISAHTD
jgi:hypothetical protein